MENMNHMASRPANILLDTLYIYIYCNLTGTRAAYLQDYDNYEISP